MAAARLAVGFVLLDSTPPPETLVPGTSRATTQNDWPFSTLWRGRSGGLLHMADLSDHHVGDVIADDLGYAKAVVHTHRHWYRKEAVITNGKVTRDGIRPHDDLLGEFPYLGPPHTNRS